MTLRDDLNTLDALTDGEADNLRTAQRQGDLPDTLAFDWYLVEDSVRQMPEDILAHYGDPEALRAALSRVMALVGGSYEVEATYALPDYDALGQNEQETVLLIAHDKDEVLHAYVSCPGSQPGGAECDCAYAHDEDNGPCAECGDTAEGLMHNNTYRSAEPLMDEDVEGDDDDTSPSPALAQDATYDEPQTFTVSISNTFEAHSPSEAVACMVAYLSDYAHASGYRVSLGMDPLADPSCFIDADDLDFDSIFTGEV